MTAAAHRRRMVGKPLAVGTLVPPAVRREPVESPEGSSLVGGTPGTPVLVAAPRGAAEGSPRVLDTPAPVAARKESVEGSPRVVDTPAPVAARKESVEGSPRVVDTPAPVAAR